MPRASTAPTLLSLDRYARIMGLDPMHFAGGYSALRPAGSCGSVWFQYDWQDRDKISREQLAAKIDEAERDLADQLGYWPAPVWIEAERQPYPRPQRTDLYQTDGLNIRGRWKSCRLKWGYIIEGGQRATELIAHSCSGSYDYDGDGFSEMTLFVATVAADFDPCEVRAYFKEYAPGDAANCRTDPASNGADPAWEIQIAKVELSGVTLNVYVQRWNLFKPQLQEELDPESLDADTATNYVDDVLLYRVYTDPQDQAEFMWHTDVSCTSDVAAAYSTQSAAFSIRDRRSSVVVPEPADWVAANSAFSKGVCWTESRDPDYVRFWYRAGYTPERAHGCEMRELDNWWAETIAMLTTARLMLPLCNCNVAKRKADFWQTDLAEVGADRSFNIDPVVVTNPLGTRRGEVDAWRRLVKARGRQKGQAVLV